MKATINYDEISALIRKKSKVCPKFTTVDNETIEVRYKHNMFIPEISVRVHIEATSKDVIRLSYDCSSIATMLVSGAIQFLGSVIPNGITVNTENKRIDIYPESIEKVAKAYKYMSLSDIAFTEDAVNVLFEI